MRLYSKRRLVNAFVVAAAVVLALAVALSRSGREFRRLLGVDSPERGERFYNEARRHNASLLARGRQTFAYGPERRDRYGRILAYVYVTDGKGDVTFVNAELVRAGWARTLEIPPNTRFAATFAAAEEEARRARRGVWSAPGGEE